MLAGGHAEDGESVHVAALVASAGARGEFLAPLAARGVTTHEPVIGGRAYLHERATVGALCKQTGAQVVHTHGYRPDVVAAGAARRLGIPTVTTVHGFTGG